MFIKGLVVSPLCLMVVVADGSPSGQVTFIDRFHSSRPTGWLASWLAFLYCDLYSQIFVSCALYSQSCALYSQILSVIYYWPVLCIFFTLQGYGLLDITLISSYPYIQRLNMASNNLTGQITISKCVVRFSISSFIVLSLVNYRLHSS